MPIIRGAKVLVVNNDDNVLVVRRSNTHPWVPLTNDLPGGKVEDSETMAEGAVRELKEETGISTEASSLRKVNQLSLDNYHGKDYMLELFVVQLDTTPEVILSYEHDKYEWVPLEKVEIVGEAYEKMLEEYRNSD